jgi:hypothetical protein
MDARTFFGAVERLLAIAPPRTADRAAVESMRRGGLLGSHDRGPAITGAVVDNGVADGMRNGLALVQAQAARPPVEAVGQWHIRYRLGQFGTDYLRRAGAACAGLVTESAADEVPAGLRTDADGRPLSGKHWYVLRFAPDRPPPVHGFWSLSTYDGQGSVAPCAARASIGDADGLTVDIDGSLPIHIQPEPPAGRGNWLAAPPGDFTLVLRLFWPLTEVLERRWRPPEVTRVG